MILKMITVQMTSPGYFEENEVITLRQYFKPQFLKQTREIFSDTLLSFYLQSAVGGKIYAIVCVANCPKTWVLQNPIIYKQKQK